MAVADSLGPGLINSCFRGFLLPACYLARHTLLVASRVRGGNLAVMSGTHRPTKADG